MIEGDVRDHAHAEVEDVGGVEPPAQAHLADEEVDACARKVKERRAGEDLELGRRAELRRNLINDGLQLRQQRREVGFRDRPLIHLDPFGVGDEVGLRHQADAIARRLQDAGQHGAHRPLAVCPGHQHALEELVGVAECVQKRLGSLQAELDAEAAERGQVIERVLVGHDWPRCWR